MISRRLFSLLLAMFLLSLPGTATRTVATEDAPALSGVYRVEGSNPDGSRYRGMAAITQNKAEYTVQWWIETRTYSGTGRMQDGKLVVKWGEEAPVIYTLQPGGKLNGTWAGGKATDRLTLYAGGTTAPVRVHLGSYAAEGAEPSGRRYKGAATITRVDDRYDIEWTIDNTTNTGHGKIVGNLLIVTWNHEQPVIYAAGAYGSLVGLWASGVGNETLTPVP